MRKTLVLLMICGLLTGCPDSQAQRRSQINVQFDAAVAQFEKARRDYADPITSDQQDPAHTREFLEQQLTEAQKLLVQFVKQTDANDKQIVSAQRMLADVYAAQARDLARQATAAWAGVERSSAALLLDLHTLAQIDNRAKLAGLLNDESLTQAHQDQLVAERRKDQLQTDIKKLAEQISRLQAQMKSSESKRFALLAQVTELEQQAYTEQDADKRLETEKQAIELRRQAAALTNDVQELREVKLDVFESEHAYQTQQLVSTQSALAFNQQQIADQEQRRKQAAQTVRQTDDQRAKATRKIYDQFDVLTKAYADGVERPLGQSVSLSRQAADALQSAQTKEARQAAGAPQSAQAKARQEIIDTNIATEILARQSELAKYQSDQVIYAGQFSRVIGLLDRRSQELLPQYAADFRQDYLRRTQQLQTMQTQAQQTLTSTSEAITELLQSASDDATQQLATAHQQRLDVYRDQLDQATLPPPQENGAEPSTSTDFPKPSSGLSTPLSLDSAPDSSFGSSGAPITAPAVVMQGELPELPDVAFSESVIVHVTVDGRQLSPQAIQAMLKNLLGPMYEQMAGQIEMGLAGYRAGYAAAAEAGALAATAIALSSDMESGNTPNENSFVLIALKPGANVEAVKQLFMQFAPAPSTDEVSLSSVGDWLMAAPNQLTPPTEANTARKALFEQAAAVVSDAPIRLVLVPDGRVREMAKQMQEADAAPNAIPVHLTEEIHWAAVGLRLKNNPGFDAAIQMTSADHASELKTYFDEQIKKISQPPDLSDPNSAQIQMMLSGFFSAMDVNQFIQVQTVGPQVRVAVNLQSLTPMIPMLMQMMPSPTPDDDSLEMEGFGDEPFK